MLIVASVKFNKQRTVGLGLRRGDLSLCGKIKRNITIYFILSMVLFAVRMYGLKVRSLNNISDHVHDTL